MSRHYQINVFTQVNGRLCLTTNAPNFRLFRDNNPRNVNNNSRHIMTQLFNSINRLAGNNDFTNPICPNRRPSIRLLFFKRGRRIVKVTRKHIRRITRGNLRMDSHLVQQRRLVPRTILRHLSGFIYHHRTRVNLGRRHLGFRRHIFIRQPLTRSNLRLIRRT